MGGDTFSSAKLNAVLVIIVKLLHSYNISNWFIGYGTLLGIIREESCIDGDDDVDIVINITQKEKLIQLIKEHNFKYIYNRPNFFKIEIETGMPTIDFYLANVDDKGNFNDTWENTIWSNTYDLVQKEWNNLILYLPNNYKTNLENRYGDWKIPKKSKGVTPKKKII